ncbi:hypothetical protein K505DRAFT_366783 [Melanomma pulvis-pyrius CBS 109.77]|uniref:SprT-like domain-containing protein n=1 Tax=Melanomma pulvis-pyrius CBS 109.77 TaxID=1314802 RepID=A0A6A6WVY3_9PLEO|nr:hypothetical protein K505DRAFT_366783 [Melanomma pulvis-pyrius CBS 109.77]
MQTDLSIPLRFNPKTIQDIADFSFFIDELCTCDKHSPNLYRCRNPHLPIPCGTFTLNTPNAYDAIHLAHAAIAYFDRPEEALNPTQKQALMEFRKIIHAEGKSTTLHKLGYKNAGKAVRKANMLQILNIFNRLFFFGALRLDFKWEALNDPGSYNVPGRTRLGRCRPPNSSCAASLIELDTVYTNTEIQGLARHPGPTLSRLGTLLHEVIHAYIQQYACNNCEMRATSIGYGGHGRAFQMMAARLEEVTESLFGDMRLDIGAGGSFLGDWRACRVLPSRCDLAVWNWEVSARSVGT